MYFYLFDSFLQERRYAGDLAQIETRLATLGIAGRNEKITILKNIREAARSAIKRGATTIVVVGNDQTVTKILPDIIDQPVTLGLIPVGPQQIIAKYLGLSEGPAACDAISRRIVRRLDLGRANSFYFLLNAVAPANVAVECDGQYRVTSLDPSGIISVMNFGTDRAHGRPDDGRLELVIESGNSHSRWGHRSKNMAGSVFPLQQAKISCPTGEAAVLLDGQVTVKTPLTIEVVPNKIEVIVGKQRSF